MNEAEPAVPGAGTNDRWRLDGRVTRGQQSLDDLRRVVEVNLISVMDLYGLTADLLRATPAASVINVASMYGIVASRSPMAA
jgi:short-subunit dehydrogenase